MTSLEARWHVRHSVGDFLNRTTYTGDRSPEIFGTAKSMAAAEAWDAALPLAPTWVLASVAALPLP